MAFIIKKLISYSKRQIMNKSQKERWVVPPSHLKLSMPFIKAMPVKPLDNDQMEYQILTDRGKQYIPLSIRQAYEVSSASKTFQDMCEMTVLNEPEVLNNLVQRYKKDQIFTYIGPTLIIINPYRILKKFFSQQAMLQIRDKIIKNQQYTHPHVYMTAGKAYKQMLQSQNKQAIVISGESGAGKTQSTKYCMQILTSLSHKKSHSIQAKILACNPVLEAFGNSKTVRNDNSSRFGKYVQIFFGDDHTIKGANINSYLLQKSRVVSVAKNQRSFHAFYALTASGQYKIKEPSYYKYLKQSGCYKASNIDDKKYFEQINESMKQIGFSQKQRDTIWQLIKAILDIGNIDFDGKKHVVNQSQPCQISNKQSLKSIAQSLSIEEKQLQKILLYEKKKFLKQYTLSPYNQKACISNRNTLSKAIYNVIFQFILHKIQNSLHPDQKHGKHYKSINILDIFGFQNFEQNSFEQLCINYTNEKLLKLYNKYIFQRQMELLREDGLDQQIRNIIPPTNDDVIELINGKLSIFSLINDFTPQQQYKDEDIINGLNTKLSKSKLIKFNKLKAMQFAIVHSQCQVNYKAQGFKNKNLDKINLDVEEIVTKLFVNKNKQQAGKTLLIKFNIQIQNLLTQLTTSNVHFIRCIKPNETKVPSFPDQSYILTQIRYLGVFQTIQIRKKTFPSRKTYEQFAKEYKILFQDIDGPDKSVTQKILKSLNCKNTQYLLGNRRVYVNQQIQQTLNKQIYKYLKIKNEKVKKMQVVLRRFIFKAKVNNNLKLLIKRKQIWIKIAHKAKFQLIKHGFSLLKQLNQKKIQELKKKALLQARRKREEQDAKLSKIKFQQKKQKIAQAGKNIQKAYEKYFMSKFFQQIKKLPSSTKQKTQINPTISSLKKSSTSKQTSQKTADQLNETVLIDQPQGKSSSQYKPLYKAKQKQANKQYKFNQTFYEEKSVYVSQQKDRIFSGNLKIPMFQKSPQTMKSLEFLRKILAEKYKVSYQEESQLCSPMSSDCSFKIQQTPQDIMNRILTFPIDDFFSHILRKRTNFIGVKKNYHDILVAKPRPLTKSLTDIPQEDQLQALKVFKLLIKLSQQSKLDNVFKYVENIVLYCQNSSTNLKNEVFIQLLKQSNNPVELAAVRIYQTFAVYLHIYAPQPDFLYAGLHIYFNKLAQKKYHQKEEEFLRYTFKKMIRKIQQPNVVGYMPIKYQIMALMSKRQISVPVYLPIGSSILIKIQSYHTFADVKQAALKQLGINVKRISPQYFTFFQIINFENQELEESPVNQASVVWDVMTYWQLAKVKYQETGIVPPSFFIMMKIRYPCQCSYDDEELIQLYFAQCYFDFFIGRIKLGISQIGMLAACVKKIKLFYKPKLQIVGCYPLWALKMHKEDPLRKHMLDNLEWLQQNGLDQIAIKFKFLQVCQQCPLAMSLGVPTQQSIKIFLKPKRIFLSEKGEILQQYSLRNVAKWTNDKQKFTFQIRSKDGTIQNKTHIIYSEYSQICTNYLNDISRLLMKSSQAMKKQEKILVGL